jgi:transposase-like protein
MSKREYRRFTAEQKIEILREADQPGVTVSEVCRRHGLSPSVLNRPSLPTGALVGVQGGGPPLRHFQVLRQAIADRRRDQPICPSRREACVDVLPPAQSTSSHT